MRHIVLGVSLGFSGSAGQGQLRLCLLGGFGLLRENERIPLSMPSQRLLALLGLDPNRSVPRSFVAGTLWPEVAESAARSNLRSALSRLGPHRNSLVESTLEVLKLRSSVGVDLQERRELCRFLLDPSRDGGGVLPDLFAADILPDWNDVWVEPERESYRQLRLHALETLSEDLVGEARFGEALEAGLIAVSAAPLRETAHRTVIRALLAEGNRGEAFGHYQRLRDLLYEQLGVEPSFRLEEALEKASARPSKSR